jgi:hypothetical protein
MGESRWPKPAAHDLAPIPMKQGNSGLAQFLLQRQRLAILLLKSGNQSLGMRDDEQPRPARPLVRQSTGQERVGNRAWKGAHWAPSVSCPCGTSSPIRVRRMGEDLERGR